MKLLMTADAVGGVWTYALELSAALARHDVTIVLAIMGPAPDRAQRTRVQALPHVELVQSAYRLEWMQDPWDDVSRAGDWLLSLAQRYAVDAVHLNGYVHASLPWQCPTIVVAHSCVCSWWRAVHGADAPGRWYEYRDRVTQGLCDADYVVAPTRAFLQQLRTCHEFVTPASVIGNASAATATAGEDDLPRLPIVFSCGRAWDRAKNLAALDAIAAQLPWHAYVAGSTAGPEVVAEFSSVRRLGTLCAHDIAEWLSRAAIFVHPALYEPFGLSVLEAATHGCALALADLPSLRELWDGAAEFFDPRDPEELATVLQRLIAHPDVRQLASSAASTRARTFRIDSTADRYAELYRRLTAAEHIEQQALA